MAIKGCLSTVENLFTKIRTSIRAGIVGVVSVSLLYIVSWEPLLLYRILHSFGILKIPINQLNFQVVFDWCAILYYVLLLGLGFGYLVADKAIVYGAFVILAYEALGFLKLWSYGFGWQDFHILLCRWGVSFIIATDLIIWLALVWSGAKLHHFINVSMGSLFMNRRREQ